MLICALASIANNVGAPRILPAIAIPHPTGNPALSTEDEYEYRKKLVRQALDMLTAPLPSDA